MSEKIIRSVVNPCSLVLLCLCFFWLAPVCAAEPEGGDSPQAVFDAAQQAAAENDLGGLVKLFPPQDRYLLALSTDMAVGMFQAFYEGEKSAELEQKYQAIQKKYGIKKGNVGEKLKTTENTSEEEMEAHMRKRSKELYGHVDVAKYVPELMALMSDIPEVNNGNNGSFGPSIPQEKLSDLAIDGDRATGKAGKESVSFVREDGRWYIAPDED